MDLDELIAALIKAREEYGNLKVLMSDSHLNNVEVVDVEYMRYARPTLLLNTTS